MAVLAALLILKQMLQPELCLRSWVQTLETAPALLVVLVVLGL
jgi:hypothetical protein